MNSFRAAKAIKVLLCITVFVLVAGFVVKGLWNALMPEIFGLHALTFWQALGLLAARKASIRRLPSALRRWQRNLAETVCVRRWEKMTPEEREKFRDGMRCGRRPFGRPVQS